MPRPPRPPGARGSSDEDYDDDEEEYSNVRVGHGSDEYSEDEEEYEEDSIDGKTIWMGDGQKLMLGQRQLTLEWVTGKTTRSRNLNSVPIDKVSYMNLTLAANPWLLYGAVLAGLVFPLVIEMLFVTTHRDAGACPFAPQPFAGAVSPAPLAATPCCLPYLTLARCRRVRAGERRYA